MTLENVEGTYIGRAYKCCCGCAGTHREASDINDAHACKLTFNRLKHQRGMFPLEYDQLRWGDHLPDEWMWSTDVGTRTIIVMFKQNSS